MARAEDALSLAFLVGTSGAPLRLKDPRIYGSILAFTDLCDVWMRYCFYFDWNKLYTFSNVSILLTQITPLLLSASFTPILSTTNNTL